MQLSKVGSSARRSGRAFTLAAVVALCGSGVALAAHPAPRAHFSGKTRQGRKMSLAVSSNGKRVVRPRLYLTTGCSNGFPSFASTSKHNTATASGPINARGAFSLRFSESARFFPRGGVRSTAKAKFTVRGRFTSRTRASGTASVTVRYSTGLVCTSGHVKFTLKG